MSGSEFNYARWKDNLNKHMAEMRERVLQTLSSGKTVIEYIGGRGKPWRAGTDWNCTCTDQAADPCCPAKGSQHSLMKPWRTAEYLTHHLMNRHEWFGWDLEIDGVRYHLGEAINA